MTLEELKAAVADGWTVDVRNSENLDDDRDGCTVEKVTPEGFVIRARHPWRSQGHQWPTMNFTWDGDEEVTRSGASGVTVQSYITGTSITSRSTPGVRRAARRFVFHAPKGY